MKWLAALLLLAPLCAQASGFTVWPNDKAFSYPDLCGAGDCPNSYTELASFPDEFWDRLVSGSFSNSGSYFWIGEWDGYGWVATCNHCGGPSFMEFIYGPHDGKAYKKVGVFYFNKNEPDAAVYLPDMNLLYYEPFAKTAACTAAGVPYACCTGPYEGDGTGSCAGPVTDALPGYDVAPIWLRPIDEIPTNALAVVAGRGVSCSNLTNAWYLECNDDPAHGYTGTIPACCTGTYYKSTTGCSNTPGLANACLGGVGVRSTCAVDPDNPTFLGGIYQACTSAGTPQTTGGGLTVMYSWRTIKLTSFVNGLNFAEPNYGGDDDQRTISMTGNTNVNTACIPTCTDLNFCTPTATLSQAACTQDHASQDSASSGDSGSPTFVWDSVESRWLFLGNASAGTYGIETISGNLSDWLSARYGRGITR